MRGEERNKQAGIWDELETEMVQNGDLWNFSFVNKPQRAGKNKKENKIYLQDFEITCQLLSFLSTSAQL